MLGSQASATKVAPASVRALTVAAPRSRYMSSVPVSTAAVRPDAANSAAAAMGESTPAAPRASMPPAASRF